MRAPGEGVSRCFSAVGQLVVLAALIWSGVFALAFSSAPLALYPPAYANSIGHYFAGQIRQARGASRPVCLIVGMSSARAGFDSTTLERTAPTVHFVNAGTAGGSIFAVEAETAMLRDYGVRPDCIVLALHPFLLQDRLLGLSSGGYLDVMRLSSMSAAIRHENAADRAYTYFEAAKRVLWPPLRLGTQLSRVIRSGLAGAQPYVFWRASQPKSAFEYFGGELEPMGEHDADVDHRWAASQLEDFDERMRALVRDGAYASPEHLESLRRTLLQAQSLSPRVVVVVMPESRSAREIIGPAAAPQLFAVLGGFEGARSHVIDERARFPDEAFDAAFHLLPRYSIEFSEEMAPKIAAVMGSNADGF